MKNYNRCIAHEIRNQISICELYSRIIEKNLEKANIKNESIKNALNCISKSLKIMSNNLIDLKSLDNINLNKFDICNLLKEAVNLSMIYIQDKNIEITLSCANSVEVLVDDSKFIACVINIIKNAIEAIEKKGEIKIEEFINKNNVHIIISNNGPKINDIDKIFEEGFTTKNTGNGLGLAICKSNLTGFNAELKLLNSTSSSTEFEIIIPTMDNRH